MTDRQEQRRSRLAEAYHVGLLREVVKAGKITRTRGRLLEQCWRAFGRWQRTSPGSKDYVKQMERSPRDSLDEFGELRRIEDDAAGDALPEVAKVRPGLYVTLTDGSAVQITVEHIPAQEVRS